MDKDFIFIEQHKKACGEETAKKMLSELKKKQPDTKAATKVYINVYGEEVHVNGDLVAQLAKPETLAQKVARFEKLAATVRANRALIQELNASGFFDEDDEDVLSDEKIDETPEHDDFGEVIVKSNVEMSFAEPKEGAESATDNGGSESIIDGDEPSHDSPADKPSDMVEQ